MECIHRLRALGAVRRERQLIDRFRAAYSPDEVTKILDRVETAISAALYAAELEPQPRPEPDDICMACGGLQTHPTLCKECSRRHFQRISTEPVSIER